jgi:hypothetical protein
MADDIAFGMDVRRRECCGELWDMLCILVDDKIQIYAVKHLIFK